MTYRAEFASKLEDLASTIRSVREPFLLLDVVRCLLFLKYAASPSFYLDRNATPLVIPAAARWESLQHEHDLAAKLGRACRELENANPALEGTLVAVNFSQIESWDKDRQDKVLGQLIESMCELPDFDDGTQIGELYDSLVTMFAESAGRGGTSEMFLSVPLARLMVELLDLGDGMRVYDPVCKAGRTLVACATDARARQLDITLHGQERDQQLWAMCKTNLLLHGARDATIELGDALRSPMLTHKGGLVQYDRVITAPPINLSHWGAEDATEDRLGRFPIIPPKQNADYAYVLHCLSVLKGSGRAVILTGRGVLFRQGGEERIREMLVRRDCFEAIISLPGGLLYGTHIPATLLVLRKERGSHHGKVLFVEVHRPDERRARHEALRAEEIDAIASCVLRFGDTRGMSKLVELDEIARNQWNLNPAVYVPREIPGDVVDFAERAEAIRLLEVERDEAVSRVDELIRELAERFDI